MPTWATLGLPGLSRIGELRFAERKPRKTTQEKKQRRQRAMRSVAPSWNDPLPTRVCTCGHVDDEHRRGLHECAIAGCTCACFDEER